MSRSAGGHGRQTVCVCVHCALRARQGGQGAARRARGGEGTRGSREVGGKARGGGDMGFLAAAMGNCKIQSQACRFGEISTEKLPKNLTIIINASRIGHPIHVKRRSDAMPCQPSSHSLPPCPPPEIPSGPNTLFSHRHTCLLLLFWVPALEAMMPTQTTSTVPTPCRGSASCRLRASRTFLCHLHEHNPR